MNISGPWLILVWIGLFIWSTVWLLRDARKRGRHPLTVLATIMAFFPIGHLFWLMVRPPRLSASGSGTMNR